MLLAGRFRLVDKNVYPLKGTRRRFVHLASISCGLKEFMCFRDERTQRVYIEEVSGGRLERIEDDSLAQDLEALLKEKGILNIGTPWRI